MKKLSALISVKDPRKSTSKGLTLLEVMVSLSILIVGMTVMTTLTIATFQRNMSNKERLQATNLADEGVEVVKYIRDKDSSTFFTATNFDPGQIYEIGADRYIHFDSATDDWIINDLSNSPTDETSIQGMFSRKIVFSDFINTPESEEVTITCTVIWTTKEAKGVNQTVTTSTKITNYK